MCPSVMVTSVYSGTGGNPQISQLDHIRKRKLTNPTETKSINNKRSGYVNKLTKFKNATINWLNGLPPTDYDSALYDFNADNEQSQSHSQRGKGSRNKGINNENIDENSSSKEAKFKGKIEKLKKLFKKKTETDFEFEATAIAIAAGEDEEAFVDSPDNLNLGSSEVDDFEKVGKVQNLEETQYLEIRSNVREIFLPPDIVGQRKFLRNLTPKMRKKFSETHPWTVSNEIRTAKYTIFNFIPKNLFEQFRRVANVYFLILIILQGIPIFSNTNIFLAASPLVSILLITAIKDAVEDWKRQKSDNLVNHSIVDVLDRTVEIEEEETQNKNFFQKFIELFKNNNLQQQQQQQQADGWKKVYWKDIRVGDIVLMKNNESIPADIIVLSTSNSQGICYVETKNLDGETNLKIRQAPKQTAQMTNSDQLEKLSAVLQVEPPSTKLYTFNGKMILPTEVIESGESQVLDAEAFPITPDNLLLRGCQIRNTEFVIGVVAYTGPHSKIIMNSGKTPSKRSRIEKQMNPQIILSFILLVVICLTCAIMQGQYVGGSFSQAPYWYSVYKTGAMASPIFTGFLTFW
jgi:magnesium-transporting ATPase (P-type)